MMNWLYYLLETNLYLALFYGFYRLFLHRETFYTLNRYYLLLAVLISFILPFLQISYLNQLLTYNDPLAVRITTRLSATNNQYNNADIFTVKKLALAAYIMVVIFFTIKLIRNLYSILSLAFKAKRQRIGKIIHVEWSNSDPAFSFFNLLFINPSTTEKNTILRHEMVHIHQKHSLDVLFFEIVQIICWFNPVAYLIKKDIKLLHEYIADDLTTDDHDIHKHEYAMFLIQNSFGIVPNQLANQMFNQSILKKRIKMLNKEKSAGRTRFRLLLALPIAGGMLCASTMAFTKDYAMIDLYPKQYESVKAAPQEPVKTKSTKQAPKKTVKRDQVKFPPPIVKKDKIKFPPPIVKPDKAVPPPPPAPPKAELNDDDLSSNLKKDGLLKKGTESIEFSLKGNKVFANGVELSDEISKKYITLLNLKENEGLTIDFVAPTQN
jgi:beta-lactamase regulating signal transducer with metallopeptidase domain